MTTDDMPLPSPPFIEIPGLRNFRDAGGYPVTITTLSTSSPPKIIRRGLLFRASEPSMVTDHGIRIMTDELRIAKVYDLRSQAEIDRDTAPGSSRGGRYVREWAGAERVFAPVFGDEDYSPEAIAVRFSNFSRMGSEVCV